VATPYGVLEIPVIFGGEFYALAPAPPGITVGPRNARGLIDFSMVVKNAIEEQVTVVHPLESDLRGTYGTIITGVPTNGADGRNVTIFADGEVDRSLYGTSTAARLAELHATGKLAIGQEYVLESIIGTRFTGRVLGTTRVGEFPATVPEVDGRGFLTGIHTFIVEPDDPTQAEFLVR